MGDGGPIGGKLVSEDMVQLNTFQHYNIMTSPVLLLSIKYD